MSKLRIGFLFMHPLSESLGSTTRLIEIANALNKKGFRVIIYDPFEKTRTINSIEVKEIKLCGILDYGLKKAYKLLKKIYYGKATRSLTASKIFQQNFLYKRIAKKLVEKIKEDRIDILIIEQDFAIVPGLRAAKEAEIKSVVDLHNITAEELVAANIIKENSVEYQKMQEQLKLLLREVDGIIVVSEALKKYVYETYGIKNNVILVPPAGTPRIEKIPERQPPYKLIYAGLVSYREKVDIFVKSLPYLKDKLNNYEVYMTKKGEELEKIKKLSKQQDLHINFFWFETRKKLFEFMKNCHVGILTSSKNKARMLGPPVKLFDYMSVGLPVVANYIGGWSDIIKKERIGIVTSEIPKEFANGILDLVEDPETYYSYANNALKAVKQKYNLSLIHI